VQTDVKTRLVTLGSGMLLALGCGGCLTFADATVSEGYRDGEVQKFSRTGLLWKTHEGEMGLSGFRASRDGDGATSNVWYFTASDPAVVEALSALPPGATVRLHYRKALVARPWAGNTRHFVTKVEAR